MLNRIKQLIILIFEILVLCIQVNAQNKDSLQHALIHATTDSARVSILEELATGGNYSEREESIGFYRQILGLNISNQKRAETLNRIGYFNWQLGNYEAAIVAHKQALELFKEQKDSLFIGRVYNNIAVSNWGLGNNIEALQNYQLSLKIRRKLNDKKGVSTVLNNIGKIYSEIGLFDDAFKMHKEALQIAQEINETHSIAYSYSTVGDCYEHFDMLDTALAYYIRGYNLLLADDTENRLNSYFSLSIAGVYFQLDELDSALHYNLKALDYAHRINNKNRICHAEYELGKTYLTLNNISLSQKYFDRSLKSANEMGYVALVKDNLFALAQVEEIKGNKEKAFELFKEATMLNESLYNDEVVSKIADIQIKYLTEHQEQENILLRKNNQIQQITIRQQKALTWFLIIGTLMVLIILLFISKSHLSIRKLNQQLEQSEKSLKKANADKDKFFTIIAHDLRTPLNGLLGITELLESDHEIMPSSETKELLVLLRKSSVNLHSLIEGLLQWAQTQIGSMEYNFKAFDFHINSMNIADTMGPVATTKKIALINTIPPGTMVFADERSSLTVLRNLVSNAIKFTHAGGTIQISAREELECVVFSVSDDGVGMRKAKMSKLFSIDEKISQKGTNDEIGTGLGLILCKEFVETNKGKIWVKSEPGIGSTFSFSLPKNEKQTIRSLVT